MPLYLTNNFFVLWIIKSLELHHVHMVRINELSSLEFEIIKATRIRVDDLCDF